MFEMEDKFYQCKLEHHIRCDMNGKCLLCIKKENIWADKWIKSLKHEPIETPELEYMIEKYEYQQL